MLKTSKTINLTAQSCTEDGVPIVTMTFMCPQSGRSVSNTTVVSEELYDANKEMVRQDIDAFTELTRSIEDENSKEV